MFFCLKNVLKIDFIYFLLIDFSNHHIKCKKLQNKRFDSHKEARLLLRLPRFKLNTTEEMEQELKEIKKEQARIKSLGSHSAVLMPAEELSSDYEFGDNWIPELDRDIEDERSMLMFQ